MIRTSILAAALLVGGGFTLPASAHDGHGHHSGTPAPAVTVASSEPLVQGVVRSIDKAAGRITIMHGWIRHLDMPPMAMTYSVRGREELGRLKVGDKIQFSVQKKGEVYTVTRLEKAG
jgi:Cu/Ag efflux protein CusF